MAYTWIAVASAFAKTETHPEGLDYQTALELLNNITDIAQGRLYVDASGNLTFESRFHRDA
jgi:hypothetical protein